MKKNNRCDIVKKFRESQSEIKRMFGPFIDLPIDLFPDSYWQIKNGVINLSVNNKLHNGELHGYAMDINTQHHDVPGGICREDDFVGVIASHPTDSGMHGSLIILSTDKEIK
jgi:hypothetical protein